MENMGKQVQIVTGPTAAGKTTTFEDLKTMTAGRVIEIEEPKEYVLAK